MPSAPPGFVVRAPYSEDAEVVAGIGIAQDVDDLGEADYSVDDVRSEWSAPGFDLATDAWIVHTEQGHPAAYGAVDGGDVRVFTDPRFTGRGLGAYLAERVEQRAAASGQPLIRQVTFGGNEAARALLAAHGYAREQNYWRMRIDTDRDIAAPEWPAGIAARTYEPERDEPAVHALIQRAFAEVPGFVPQDLDAWRVAWGSGERLEPGLTTVAEEVRALVGVATTGRWSDGRGWVTQLAVSPDARGRGLGRALLLASFAAAGDAGLPSVGLDVNAANESATRLYGSAGMRVEWHSDRWEKRL